MNYKILIVAFLVLSFHMHGRGQMFSLYNDSLSAIAKTTSNKTWILFKENIPFEPTTFFKKYKPAFGLTSEDDLKLSKAVNDKETGIDHLMYQQYYKGYLIYFGQLHLHIKNSVAYKANGFITAHNFKVVTRSLTANEAEKIVFKKFPSQSWLAEPTYLSWLPNNFDLNNNDPADLRLCYVINIKSNAPTKGSKFFIDANTGQSIGELPTVYSCFSTSAPTVWYNNQTISSASNAGGYQLKNDCGTTTIEVLKKKNGNVKEKFTSANNDWTGQQNGVTALYVAEKTASYYSQVHGRASWDNNNHPVVFLIDDPACTDNHCTGYNAYAGDTITFGNASSSALGDDFYTLDIFGHEFQHNVTAYSIPNGLTYANEPGALNESFSDIFGNSVQMWQEGYSATGNIWFMGENRVNTNGQSMWSRDMRNPNNSNYYELNGSVPQPKKYLGVNWFSTSGDYGGVHYNSGVQNYMFYLLTAGGVGDNEGISVNVNGIGNIKSRTLAYKVLTGGYLTSNANHTNARDGWVHAAEDLYGVCSNEVIQTAQAWYAVGVTSNSPAYNVQVCGSLYTSVAPVNKSAGGLLTVAGSCNVYITPSPNVANFTSGKKIAFEPGFTAPAGSTFHASIDPCKLTVH